MPRLRSLRIFISSPGDVLPERHRASQVIGRLAKEFREALELDAIFWEWEPLTAGKHFQKNIIPPSATDVVIVILWSILGTPLRTEEFVGRISGKQVTGTEWEFEDGLGAWRDTGRPDLFVYIKTALVPAAFINPDDPQLRKKQDDKRRLDRFIETWFRDEEPGVYKGAQREFGDTSAFEEMLEIHLRKVLLEKYVEKGGSRRAAGHWHGDSPFRGLEPFDVGHAAIFFGRTRARNELRDALVAQIARGSAFVAVVGASGSGKSSLVRAGLIPDLVLPGMMPGVGLVRWAILRPRDEGANPVTALATALMGALPELNALQYTKDVLSGLLQGSDAETSLPVKQGLAVARQGAQLGEGADARLLLVVDQFEELFTLSIAEDAQRSFVNALDRLARSGVAYVIATLRSEFIPNFAQVSRLAALARGPGTFLLPPPTPEDLGQIILRPAEVAGLEYEIDLRRGRRLDEQLRSDAGNNPGVLPLLEYLLERLWQERDEGGRLTFDAYARLGGLEGAIGQRAEELFLSLPGPVQLALPEVLRALVAVSWIRGAPAATSKTASLSSFGKDTPARQLIDALLAQNARLLVADGDDLRVAHEALLVHWSRAATQIAEDRRDLRTRDRIEREAAEWRQASVDSKAGLLIPAGVRLSDAEDLLARRGGELAAPVCDYIEASLAAHQEWQARELALERDRRREAELEQLRAEVAEKQAAAERGYARAERNRALARRVGPGRQEYGNKVMERARVFERQADEAWAAATALGERLRSLHTPAGEGRPAERRLRLFELDVITTGQRGGCFILRYGDSAHPRLVIVEGGDRIEYEKGLKARLTALRRQLSPRKALPVELAIVTHYDMNRVAGLLRLLEDLREARNSGRKPLAEIKSIWFNHFLPEGEPGGPKQDSKGSGAALKDRIPRIARELRIGLNEPFDYFVMASERGPTRVTVADGMAATVLSPDAAFLRKFYERWSHERKSRQDEPVPDLVMQTRLDSDDTSSFGEAVAAISEGFSSPEIELLRAPTRVLALSPPTRPDSTTANLSSIVTLFEFGGRKALLCGDSRCDLIASGLSKAGLLPADGQLHVDVLQVPHHGSRNNVTTEFFRRVTADHYVIEPHIAMFRLPDMETVGMIADARGDEPYSIHVPSVPELNWLRSDHWRERLGSRLVEHAVPCFTIGVP